MNKPRLALRLYAFVAIIVVAAMASLIILPRFARSPGYLEPQAALVQSVVDRMSTQKDPNKFDRFVQRMSQRLKGRLTVYDTQLHEVVSTSDPVGKPTDSELETLQSEKWALSWGRIAVRSDDGTMIGVYLPNRTGFPWAFVLPLGAAVLVVVGGATFWFSRRLVVPLGQLATAARAFGRGETSARAKLHRDDELGDLGRAFDDMADRTAALISSQRQLMGDVSHELRTPLARIRVALELAAEDPSAAKELLADVGADLDEIDQLIEDILTTARLDSERAEIKRQELAVGELTTKAADRFTAKYPSRQLERDIADAGRVIECDPVLLRRAIDNLLDNAAKYSDAPVELHARPNGTKVAFEIVDKGIGMSPEELERAFTPFWRADSSRARRTGGVGLGLALARRIARAHGGDVTLVSAPGRGTTARLEIPLGQEALSAKGSS